MFGVWGYCSWWFRVERMVVLVDKGGDGLVVVVGVFEWCVLDVMCLV